MAEEREEQEVSMRKEDPLLDQHILLLLDSVDRLLQLQHSLSHSLSQGWMGIASARYAMGPSRIDQCLLSLKPCPASRVISINSAEDTSDNDNEACDSEEINQQEVTSNRASALQFVLQNRSNVETSYDLVDDHECNQTCEKRRMDPITCFGKLVSPHLRAAQTSFERALEITVEIANQQSLIHSARSQVSIYTKEL